MLLAALLLSATAQSPQPQSNATAPAPAPTEVQIPAYQPPPALADPKAPFEIHADAKLLDLVTGLGSATSTAFVIDAETRDWLAKTRCGLLANLTVEPRQAWTYVENLLLANGFLLQLAPADGPPLVEVASTASIGRRPGSDSTPQPLAVAPMHLEWFARHPAFLGRTAFELRHTDVRQLVNSLRTVQTNNTPMESMINAGQANAIIVTGPGAYLVQTARLFQLIDEIGSRTPPPTQPQPQSRPPAEPAR